MADEPHDVVKLLVARMESHPEEFKSDMNGRWAQWLDQLLPFVTEAERVLLREPMMQDIHEEVLDELLNGPERRRQREEEAKYEQQMLVQQARIQQQMAAQKYAQQYGNAFPQSLGKPLSGKSATHTIFDEYANITRNTTSVANALQLGSEKLDEGILKKLKGLLK
jgi:hypothetical protein